MSASPPASSVEPKTQLDPRTALRPGSVFAKKFLIEGTLGAGGTGAVYLATDKSSDERIALKVLHRHLISNAQVVRRFNREARILRSLSGPHLVSLRDHGEGDSGRLYLALEYVDCLPLDAHLANMVHLPEREAATIAIQICHALSTAHRIGVVHRDLKPANVLLETTADGSIHARVVDFGMAKILRDSGLTSSMLTEQNMVFGTPEYMAPEQVRGDEPDARCDVYALGIMLYEMLSGEVPFRAPTSVATMTAHLSQVPKPLGEKGLSLSPAIESVVHHALAKEVEDRYPSAEALRHALRNALAHPDDVASTQPPSAEADLAMMDTAVPMAGGESSIPPPALEDEEAASTQRDILTTLKSQSGPQSGPPLSEDVPSLPKAPTVQTLAPEPATPRLWVWVLVAGVASLLGLLLGLWLANSQK